MISTCHPGRRRRPQAGDLSRDLQFLECREKLPCFPTLCHPGQFQRSAGALGQRVPLQTCAPSGDGTLSCRLRGGHSLCIKARLQPGRNGTNRAAASLTTNVTPRWFKICPEMCDSNHLLSCVIALLLNCDVETCAMCGCLWLHTSAWPPGKYRYTVKTV